MTTSNPIVVLNGAPRSGKTTIAGALAAEDDRPWTGLGVETSRAATPEELQPGIGLRPGGERPDLEDALPGLLAALVEQVVTTAAGAPVAVDVGLHDGHSRPLGLWAVVADHLADHPTWVVGVRCPLGEVVRRRRASGPAYESVGPDGSPTAAVRRWQDTVHRPGIYDLEVDTSALAPGRCAGRILDRVDRGPAPTALARLAASGV